MKIKYIVLIIIIIIQLVVVSSLATKIFHQKKSVLGATYINPINKENIIMNKNSEFKYFYEPKPNTVDEKRPSWLTNIFKITINSDGLNERFEYNIQKPTNTYRIITLGDSYTYGVYVNTESNYPERLENLLNYHLKCKSPKRFEVINLGVGGYDIQYSVERYKIRGQKHNPDLVIWLIHHDNFIRITEKISPLNKLCTTQDKMSEKERFNKGILYKCWGDSIKYILDEMGETKMSEFQKTALNKINDYFKEKILLVTFSRDINKNKEFLRKFVNTRNNTYIYDSLIDMTDDNSLPDRHPSSSGYNLIAEDLLKYIIDNKIIPCN